MSAINNLAQPDPRSYCLNYMFGRCDRTRTNCHLLHEMSFNLLNIGIMDIRERRCIPLHRANITDNRQYTEMTVLPTNVSNQNNQFPHLSNTYHKHFDSLIINTIASKNKQEIDKLNQQIIKSTLSKKSNDTFSIDLENTKNTALSYQPDLHSKNMGLFDEGAVPLFVIPFRIAHGSLIMAGSTKIESLTAVLDVPAYMGCVQLRDIAGNPINIHCNKLLACENDWIIGRALHKLIGYCKDMDEDESRWYLKRDMNGVRDLYLYVDDKDPTFVVKLDKREWDIRAAKSIEDYVNGDLNKTTMIPAKLGGVSMFGPTPMESAISEYIDRLNNDKNLSQLEKHRKINEMIGEQVRIAELAKNNDNNTNSNKKTMKRMDSKDNSKNENKNSNEKSSLTENSTNIDKFETNSGESDLFETNRRDSVGSVDNENARVTK